MEIRAERLLVSDSSSTIRLGQQWASQNFDFIMQLHSTGYDPLLCYVSRTPKEDWHQPSRRNLEGWSCEIFVNGLDSTEAWKFPDLSLVHADAFETGGTDGCLLAKWICGGMCKGDDSLQWFDSRSDADSPMLCEEVLEIPPEDEGVWRTMFESGQDLSWKKYLKPSAVSLLESELLRRKCVSEGESLHRKASDSASRGGHHVRGGL